MNYFNIKQIKKGDKIMKKLKLLPSIIMLALCAGVFAMGVYAFNPSINNVAGTVTVTSAATTTHTATQHQPAEGEFPRSRETQPTHLRLIAPLCTCHIGRRSTADYPRRHTRISPTILSQHLHTHYTLGTHYRRGDESRKRTHG